MIQKTEFVEKGGGSGVKKWKYKPKGLFREVYAEMIFSAESMRLNARAIFFALGVGMVVGVVGGAFARLLSLSDVFRNEVSWSIYLLPLVGLVIVWLYIKGGIKTAGGTDIVIQAARGEQPVSRLLAPVIFVSTLLTHFFGGSAGREGAALQLGGSLAEVVRHIFRLGDEFEDLAVMCGMSAGFSAVFGNQISAVIFALEISCVGMLPMGAFLPCVVSSIVAGEVAQMMGGHAVVFTLASSAEDVFFYTRVLLLAVACGLLSIVVCYAFSGFRQLFERFYPDPYVRVVMGGVVVIILTLLLDTRYYLGSGQALIDQSIGQGQALPWDFALKILLTAITLGAGFKGGEIVPAFAIGASFGCVLGPLLGLDPSYAAAIGMVAVFCGVTNCPLTSLVLGFEVFSFCNPGGFLVAVAASFLVSGYSGLYSKQKFAFSKVADSTGTVADEENINYK